MCFHWKASIFEALSSAVRLCNTMPIGSDGDLIEKGECNSTCVSEMIALNKALPVLALITW